MSDRRNPQTPLHADLAALVAATTTDTVPVEALRDLLEVDAYRDGSRVPRCEPVGRGGAA